MIDAHRLLALARNPTVIVTADGTVRAFNSACSRAIDGIAEDILLPGIADEHADKFRAIVKRSLRTSAPLPCTLTLRLNGTSRRFKGHCLRVHTSSTEPLVGFTFALRDGSKFISLNDKINELNSEIHSRKRTQAELQAMLERNELLLKEIHHRVRNNLQIQMSLVSRQASKTGNPEIVEFAETANRRLWSLSQSLETMYAGGNLNFVDANTLFKSVADHLNDAFGDDVGIEFSSNTQWEIPIDRANSCALLLNELVTNAFKHGLNGGAGQIAIFLGEQAGEKILEVSDPGDGFSVDDIDSSNLGLDLVKTISTGIGARYETSMGEGCTARLIFPT